MRKQNVLREVPQAKLSVLPHRAEAVRHTHRPAVRGIALGEA